MNLDNALEAFDASEIARSDAGEMEQTLSLLKCIEQRDNTDLYQLLEMASFGDGLRPGAHSVVECELQRVKQERHKNVVTEALEDN
jgi:hypothetical protein